MGTEEGVEGIIKEEEVDIIEVAIDLFGIEGTLGVLGEVGHGPGARKEDLCLLKDSEADLAGHTDPLGLQDHHHLVLHPPYSKSPVSKRRGSQEKQTKKAEGEPQEESPLKSKSQEEPKDTFEHDPSESIDEFNKSATSGDIWPGLSAYDNSPRSPHSPSPIATPPSQSSSCSDAPMLSTVHSAKNTPSQHSHSIQHSPERSGSGSVGNGSSRYSPSQNSPIHHIPSRRNPGKTITPQNAPREDSRGRSSFYPEGGGDQETAKTGKFLKRFTDEESRVFLLDRGNTRDKEAPKEKGSEKGRTDGDWDNQEVLDYFSDKESAKQKFHDSEGDDTEETEDYRQFRKLVLADQEKSFATSSHWNTEEEGPKYKSKVSLKGSRESDGFREEKKLYTERDCIYSGKA